MAAENPYQFPNPLAQRLLDGLRTDSLTREDMAEHVFHILEDRMILPVRDKFKAFYGLRNPAGQTYIYCLLRFIPVEIYRLQFLRYATADQLAMQNTNCGSTAIAGYFWGQLERFYETKPENPIPEQLTKIQEQFGEADFNRFMDIKNKGGETARNHARALAFMVDAYTTN